MSSLLRSIAPLLFALCILEAQEARADVPPPGACMTLGASCNKAGPNENLPGVCRPGMCTRPEGAAGAGGVISYYCLLCELGSGGAAGNGGDAGEGGAAGASGEGGAAGTSGDAGANGAAGAINAGGSSGAGGSNGAGGSGGSGSVVDDGGCGCRLRALGSERGVAALMLGLGLVALRISRRRQ